MSFVFPVGAAAGAHRALAAALTLCLALSLPSPARAAASSDARPLRQLAAEASAVVLADVARTETYDQGRLLVHRLRVQRVLRGRVDVPEPALIDILGDATKPIVTEGERAVFLLKPQPPLTYLDHHLGDEPRFAAVGERNGVFPVGAEAEAEAIERALGQGLAVAGLEPVPARAARRTLAFAELGSPSPRLAADALLELRDLPDVEGLAIEEVDALGRALRDVRIDPYTRAGLIRLVGERRWHEAVPALARAETDTPSVLDALFAARTALGVPPTEADLRRYLADENPALRAMAARALARLEDPQALADVGRLATKDADVKVREAAVEALGKSGKPAALPVLSETFASEERGIRQASGRALVDMSTPAADQALVDLALKSPTPDVQSYAALVLLVARGRDSEAIRRLERSNPGPAVRKVLEHGLEFRHTHRPN